jgi:hypothetical protein
MAYRHTHRKATMAKQFVVLFADLYGAPSADPFGGTGDHSCLQLPRLESLVNDREWKPPVHTSHFRVQLPPPDPASFAAVCV